MSIDEICTCKACKNTVFHCPICKFVGFLLPSSSWLLKLPIAETKKLHFQMTFSLPSPSCLLKLSIIDLLDPSIQQWTGNPKGFNLSYPSTCHVWFGFGEEYRRLFNARDLLCSQPSGSNSLIRFSTTCVFCITKNCCAPCRIVPYHEKLLCTVKNCFASRKIVVYPAQY